MTSSTSRRRFLTGAATAGIAFGAAIPRIGHTARARDPRLIVVVLRGALDGLSAVPPVGDPAYARIRGALAPANPLPLDGTFALHPRLVHLHQQYKAGQAAIIHASATAYRDRSHFDGQDVLESGYPVPGHNESGWLNRALNALPAAQKTRIRGIAGGNLTPLTLRGPAEVLGWSPGSLRDNDGDLVPRVMDLYRQTDPVLAKVLDEAVRTGQLAAGYTGPATLGSLGDPKTMLALADGVSRIMAAADGPRVAVMAFESWDTHASETGRLNVQLGGLDAALGAFQAGLGPAWRDTAVLVVTEFGRTAAINGTVGTDHGTGAAAILTGGAVKGGRVIADWPGLAPAQLYQGRDLRPTTDIRAVCKGLLAELYDVPPATLDEVVFPDSGVVRPMTGLVA